MCDSTLSNLAGSTHVSPAGRGYGFGDEGGAVPRDNAVEAVDHDGVVDGRRDC